MKWCLFPTAALVLAFGQQSSTTVHYNPMGQPMPSPSTTTRVSGNTTVQTEKRQSVNGRWVPSERVEERVLRQDASGRSVERVIRRYDQDGNPAGIEKVLIEEEKRSSGGTAVRTSVFRADLNGNVSLAERRLSESRSSGDAVVTTETVERPSIDGRIEAAEKRSTVARMSADGEVRNTSVFKRDENGRFFEAEKQVAETRKSGGEQVESVATYQAMLGGFRLLDQTVKKSGKAADGSERIEVDIYTENVAGVANTSGKPQLREQQLVVRRAQGGGVAETVDVRRPSVSDPGRLGAPARISETWCQGKCE